VCFKKFFKFSCGKFDRLTVELAQMLTFFDRQKVAYAQNIDKAPMRFPTVRESRTRGILFIKIRKIVIPFEKALLSFL